MTTAAVATGMTEASERPETRSSKAAGVLGLWGSSVLYLFLPRRMGRIWARATLLEAVIIGGLNFLAGLFWAYGVALCVFLWDSHLTLHIPGHAWTDWNWAKLQAAPHGWVVALTLQWRGLGPLDKVASIGFVGVLAAVALLLPYFVLLPFAARPGRNSACVRHVARTLLLAGGAVHLGGAAAIATFILMVLRNANSPTAWVLWVGTILGLWLFVALVRAVRVDYRAAKDLPQPHDPWCDQCGYDLLMTDPAGRCPECGRPVADSTGANQRPPTAWEARPSLLNAGAIVRQLKLLVREPRTLFYSMPTLTGQPAAQRWMLLSMLAIAGISALIVPAMMVMEQVFVQNGGWNLEWSQTAIAGTAAMTLIWPTFAMMMVGIETAGIATFSRLRGRTVYLSAAAKVTCYSSILMFLWAILGGAQLVLTVYLWSSDFFIGAHAVSLRAQQLFLAGSLAVAHIGGLLWYELTVYRGIRAIQYANK